MFYRYYIISLACMVVCAIIGGWASNKVHSAYRRYDNMLNSSHMTGYDTAQRLLRANGIRDIRVGRVQGSLTDHYHPKKKEVNLSERVYGNNSLAACAVAAHEIGHVVQERKGYFPYKIRNFLDADTVVSLSGKISIEDEKAPVIIVEKMTEFVLDEEKTKTNAVKVEEPIVDARSIVKNETPKRLWLNVTDLEDADIDELLETLAFYEGDTEVYFVKGRKKLLCTQKVSLNKAFFAELSSFLPENCIKLA